MGRVGWRPYVSPISTLLTNIYGVWKGDTLGTSLDTSIYGVWNGEENANDSVGTNHGTLMNGTTITAGKLGNAFTYNAATSDYVELPQMAFKFTGDFSISMWIYNTSGSGTERILCHNYPFQAGAGQRGWKLSLNTSNQLYFIRSRNSSIGGSSDLTSATLTVPLNTWTHVGMTWNATTRVIQLLQNGEIVKTSALTSGGLFDIYYPSIDSLNYARIGQASFKGKIDAFSIWNKVLSSDEVTNLYNGGNGAQYPFSSQTLTSKNDSVGTNHATLVNGATFTTGKIGNAFTFDGVNDFVQLPNNSLNFPSTSFSVSFWVNFTNINSANYALVSNYANDGSHRGWIVGSLTSGKLYFGIYAPTLQETATTSTISINTWYHVTCVYAPNQPTKTYINGTLDSTSSTSYNPSYTATHYPGIGASKYNLSAVQQYVSNGTKIDELSVWNRELSPTEVTELYNAGTGKQYPF